MASEFIHLHNHSDYSLLDGAQTVQTLVNTVDDLGMDAVALTEHGNMFSVIPLYNEARKTGLKPIIGCEIYVAQGSRFDKKQIPGQGRRTNHLVLLAQNYTGYRNLMKLVTLGYLEGFYYNPRIDKELLRKYSDGLICLSACLKGEVPELMLKGDLKTARDTALEFAEIFPGRYYLEIQNHGLDAEQQSLQNIKLLSHELNLPLVATNDAHYSIKDHWEAHDIHICLGTGKTRDDPKRLRYSSAEFYFKSQDEMHKLFKDFPGAIENTRAIADSINLSIPMGTYHLPNFPIPQDASTQNPNQYLENLCRDGMQSRYNNLNPELESRLNHELQVIEKMGFAGYFLITADFVQYAKDKLIPVGPGRGSAAGSLVSYVLGITDIDPIKHDLLFERFLNPERVSMPDIDIDFCIERRGEVIDYIKTQYGKESVTQIITFGRMKARAVVRDVGRVIGYSFGEVDRIAKAIPDEIGITLEAAIEKSPELKEMAEGTFKELIDHSKVLEGMNRHASTHAAGVVIAPGELTDFIPLYKSPQSDDITSQYDMKGLEELGLLKMDFLGLRNLTVINQAINLISAKGIKIDIQSIDMEDKEVYDLFTRGLTIGIFQFESSGMREYLKKLKPTCIEDLIAMNALYRPGPMQNIEEFLARKHGKKEISYLHPELETILKETYGIIVYQEQVMQIANHIAGFTLAEADLMRRAMGKKNKKLMTEMSVKFVEGATGRNVSKKLAEDIFALIDKFAQYGFNKSHSTAYAYIAYQTAWLKTHYPAEFMSANMTSEMSNLNKVVILINECRKLGIQVNPPDVNISNVDFRPIDDKTISFGLNAIKNVGTKALDKIIETRKNEGRFTSLFEICQRVDQRVVNKKVLESLIMAGAMDSLEGNRARQFEAVDLAVRYGQQVQNNKNKNQVDIFGDGTTSGDIIKIPELPDVEEWSEHKSLENEKIVTGMYISGHPLLKYAEDLEEFSTFDFTEKINASKIKTVRIGGQIIQLKTHIDRKNKQMAFFNLECLGGQAEILAFSDTYARYKDLLVNDSVVFITGAPTDDSDFSDLKLIAHEVIKIENVRNRFTGKVVISFKENQIGPDDIEELHKLAKSSPGNCQLIFNVISGSSRKRIVAHNIKVSSDKYFLRKVRELFGRESVSME